ncbi:MAG: tripartite tricarboxylate transporter substrate binding protein [Deltaproteobacteria bacterium]|nr:tripartite tricarboxylate transporter substrate binding protein [Deltaproteobacteria bacterium]
MKIRNVLIAFAMACIVILPGSVFAQDWAPKGAIKIRVGFDAGGSTDVTTRLTAAIIEKQTGWNIAVENRPGGGGVTMLSNLMREKPDGMILGVGVNVPVFVTLGLRGDTVPFKIDSFDYIGTMASSENAFVAKGDAPFNNFMEFLDYAKAKGSVAVGYDSNVQQMILNAVSNDTGAKFKQIAHQSGAEQIQNLLGGHIIVACLSGEHVKYLETGELKMIGIYSKKRVSYAPDVKTIMEDGFNYYIEPYYFIAAPKGLPADVKATLAKVFDDAINSAELKEAIWNTFKVLPNNLGPEGTFEMLKQGQIDTKFLIDAGKEVKQ